MSELKGIITAIVTPFNDDGTINYVCYKQLLFEQLRLGVDGIVVGGTTGEGIIIGDELKELVAFTIACVGNQTLVIPAITEINQQKLMKKIEVLNLLSVDYLLVTTPYYLLTNETGIINFYQYIAKKSRVPVIVYHVPKRTGQYLKISTMQKILTIDNIVGVKEASGDLNYFMELAELVRDKVLLCGTDELYLPCKMVGAKGIISVFSNLYLQELKEIELLYNQNDYQGASKLFIHQLPIINLLFIEANPIPLKYLMNLAGYEVGMPQFPLAELSERGKKIINEKIETL